MKNACELLSGLVFLWRFGSDTGVRSERAEDARHVVSGVTHAGDVLEAALVCFSFRETFDTHKPA
jgi:hypothetical protein